MLKTLDDLLREETVVKVLGENVVHYFAYSSPTGADGTSGMTFAMGSRRWPPFPRK